MAKHVHIHGDAAMHAKMDEVRSSQNDILAALRRIERKDQNMSTSLDNLTTEITGIKSVVEATATLIDHELQDKVDLLAQIATLKAQADAAGNDTAHLDALASSVHGSLVALDAERAKLAVAVATVPGTPPPAPSDVPAPVVVIPPAPDAGTPA